jgi:Mrp family chromosome partitioning ATPase
MFEILKQTDSAAAPPTLPFAEPHRPAHVLRDPVPEPDPEEDEADDDEEVPFIEVGPHKSIEASPSVLAATPPKLTLPKVDLDEPLLVPADEPAAPPTVVFRPAPQQALGRHCGFATELIAFHNPDHPLSGQYRDLLTALTAALPLGRPHALVFTSPLADLPTRDVLLNVAITAARLGRRRVAVLDADLLHTSIAQRLGLPDATGLRQVFAGTTPLDDALQKTEQENLFALTAGADNSPGTLRFVAETPRSAIHQLRQRFDLLFVAGPTWDAKPEALQTAIACDAACVVLPADEADSPRVDDLFQTLPDKGVRLAGCIFVSR